MSKCTIVPVRIVYRLISVTDSIISKYPGICKEEGFMTRTQRAICIGVYQVRLKGHSQSAQVCPRKDTWPSAIFGRQWCPRLCSHNDRELKVQSFPADKTRYNFSISKYINFGCSIDVIVTKNECHKATRGLNLRLVPCCLPRPSRLTIKDQPSQQ